MEEASKKEQTHAVMVKKTSPNWSTSEMLWEIVSIKKANNDLKKTLEEVKTDELLLLLLPVFLKLTN